MKLPGDISIRIKSTPTSSNICIELSEKNTPLVDYLYKSTIDALSCFCRLHGEVAPDIKQECDEIISMGG